jgi:hypothetical protein
MKMLLLYAYRAVVHALWLTMHGIMGMGMGIGVVCIVGRMGVVDVEGVYGSPRFPNSQGTSARSTVRTVGTVRTIYLGTISLLYCMYFIAHP